MSSKQRANKHDMDKFVYRCEVKKFKIYSIQKLYDHMISRSNAKFKIFHVNFFIQGHLQKKRNDFLGDYLRKYYHGRGSTYAEISSAAKKIIKAGYAPNRTKNGLSTLSLAMRDYRLDDSVPKLIISRSSFRRGEVQRYALEAAGSRNVIMRDLIKYCGVKPNLEMIIRAAEGGNDASFNYLLGFKTVSERIIGTVPRSGFVYGVYSMEVKTGPGRNTKMVFLPHRSMFRMVRKLEKSRIYLEVDRLPLPEDILGEVKAYL